MSAPRTNLEKQTRRHIWPLVGMAVVTLFAVLLIVFWLFEEVEDSEPPAQTNGTEAPASPVPPEVIETAPQADPEAPQSPIAPQPAPEGQAPRDSAPATP